VASQRITIAKLGGMAADVAWQKLQGWAGNREAVDPEE